MLFELSHLLLCKVHLVRRIASKWKGVIGVLRVLLMVDVALSVLPVRELGLIAAGIRYRGIVNSNSLHVPRSRFHIEGFERGLLGCSCLHRMRVNDLGLLFPIVDVFFGEKARILNLILELPLIVGDRTFWVGVLNETVCASPPSVG